MNPTFADIKYLTDQYEELLRNQMELKKDLAFVECRLEQAKNKLLVRSSLYGNGESWNKWVGEKEIRDTAIFADWGASGHH